MVELAQSGRMPLIRILLLILGIISFEFLLMGISLGLLPRFVHNTLHASNVMVGVVVGLQYVATLLTRHLAGKSADTRGGKVTVTIGLLLSALSGVCCLVAIFFTSNTLLCLLVLMLARILLGIGESYLVVGMFAWGFVLVGSKNTGKVMVWTGLGMHGGMALGAPAGLYLLTSYGIEIAFAAMVLMPLVGYLLTLFLPSIPLPQLEMRLPFYRALKLVWKAGTGLAMASIGFSGIASFITLYFTQKGWDNAPLALSAFGTGYLVMRLFFAHLPDKFGGAKVAFVCLIVEVLGQVCIWQAPNGFVAILGAILTGCGMSLVFPSFGQLAIKPISSSNRGMAMAAYNAFFDLGMGITAPLAGLIAGGAQYEYIYLFGAIAAGVGLLVAYQELVREKASWAT